VTPVQDEYKALTHINVPFVGDKGEGKRYAPGQSVPASIFERSHEEGLKVIKKQGLDPALVTDAETHIKNLIEGGSLSADKDAELHPDHAPVPAGAPSVESLAVQAQALVESLGDNAPEEIRALAKLNTEAPDENK
jgi:hypothetical protein